MKPPVHPSTLPGLRNGCMQPPASGKHVPFLPPQQPEPSGSNLGSPSQPSSVVMPVPTGSCAPNSGKRVPFLPPQQPEPSGSNLGSPSQPSSAVMPVPTGSPAYRFTSSSRFVPLPPPQQPEPSGSNLSPSQASSAVMPVPSGSPDAEAAVRPSGTPKPGATPVLSPSAPAPATAAVHLEPEDQSQLPYAHILPAPEDFKDPQAAADAAEAEFKHAQALSERAAVIAKQQGTRELDNYLLAPQGCMTPCYAPCSSAHDSTDQSQQDPEHSGSAKLPLPPPLMPPPPQQKALSGYVLKSADELKTAKKQMYGSQAEGEAAEKRIETLKDCRRLQDTSGARDKSQGDEVMQAKDRAARAEAKIRELQAQLREARETALRLEERLSGLNSPAPWQRQPEPTKSAVERNPEPFVNTGTIRTGNMLEAEVRVVASPPTKPTKTNVQDKKKNSCCTVQ